MSTITPSKPQLEYSPFPGRRFTVQEYRRMGESSVLTEDDRVELLEGWIVPKMIHSPAHDGTVAVIDNALVERLPAGWHVRVQSAITTSDSEPEPDLVIARGRAGEYLQRHPGPAEIALVIEVAETSLSRDRDKRRLCARSGIPLYWIVNLVDRRIEVYTDPTGEDPEPAFRLRRDFVLGDEVPLVLAGDEVARWAVDQLMPPAL